MKNSFKESKSKPTKLSSKRRKENNTHDNINTLRNLLFGKSFKKIANKEVIDDSKLSISEMKHSDKYELYKIVSDFRHAYYINVYKTVFRSWFTYALHVGLGASHLWFTAGSPLVRLWVTSGSLAVQLSFAFGSPLCF